MATRPYNLLIAAGKSPQVITETLFELHRTKGWKPAAVHVVTTELGRAYGEALLLGKNRTDPSRGTAIGNGDARWPEFCEEVLDRHPDNIDLQFHVPEVGGSELPDIRQQGDDSQYADLCYRLVEKQTREDQFPLIGSIAGGRKTMSAHLMTAFSVYARPDDYLTHILLTDPSLEHDPSFFYPESGPQYSQLLDLVEVEFPRLRTLLESDLIENLPDDRRDLRAILDALEPHVNSARDVSTVRLELLDKEARLLFEGEDKELGRCALTPKQAATLLVFFEVRADTDGPAPNTSLVENEHVEAGRDAVRWLFSKDEPFASWTETSDVSKAISDLNDALQTVPVAERLLHVEGVSSSPRRYDWPGDAPPLTVAARHPDEEWPFDHIPDLQPLS